MTASGSAPVWRHGDPPDILRAVLARGGVLAIPTESSYGLAADPRNAEGVEAIYRVKERERGQPLPVVAADRGQIASLPVRADEPWVHALAAFWPAPLSLLLELSFDLPAAAGSGRLAVRVPAHEGLRRLLGELGTPLTATSANRSGEPPLRDPEATAQLLAGHDAVVVDGGPLPGGAPSTLVGFRAGRLEILRAGAFPADRLRAAAESARD